MGDYALKLAERLRSDYGQETIFAAAAISSVSSVDSFDVVAPLASVEHGCGNCRDIILHYVNYGYQERGLPVQLPSLLRRLRDVSRWAAGHSLS